jgi:hypothetical protein
LNLLKSIIDSKKGSGKGASLYMGALRGELGRGVPLLGNLKDM